MGQFNTVRHVEERVFIRYSRCMPRLPIDDGARIQLRPYILECFRRMGKSFDVCEQCGKHTSKLDIHHTKYDGATVYDLQLVCRSCNLSLTNLDLI